MPARNFQLIPASYLILIEDGRILLSRRFNTGYEDGNYSLVAGHLNGGETFREAMVREAKEEADITLDVKDLDVVHVIHRLATDKPNEERLDVFLTTKRYQGEPKNLEPDRCDDIRWFSLDKLPKNMVPCVRQALGCVKKRIYYSEFGF